MPASALVRVISESAVRPTVLFGHECTTGLAREQAWATYLKGYRYPTDLTSGDVPRNMGAMWSERSAVVHPLHTNDV